MSRLQKNISFSKKNESIYELIDALPPSAGSDYVCDAIRFYEKYKYVIPLILSELQAIKQGMSTVHSVTGGSSVAVSKAIDDDVYSMIADEDD